MSLRIQVKGGTRSSSDQSLCDSCVACTHIQGASTHQERRFCNVISKDILYNVETCSSYRRFGELSLYELSKMALIIEKRKSGEIGFLRSSAWREKHHDEDLLPGEDY